jgi:hypothetical protein
MKTFPSITGATEDYKGFTIAPDNMYGFSLLDRNGEWCTSMRDKEKLKEIVDNIIKIGKQN